VANGTLDSAVAGVDVGAQCVKVVLLAPDGKLVGRAAVPTRGYFQDRYRQAMAQARAEAQLSNTQVRRVVATGFASRCAHTDARVVSETACHARGAYHHLPQAMTVLDLGGREARALRVDEDGRWVDLRAGRKCAWGIGTFLAMAAERLDVHPTRLMDLAAAAGRPAELGSYCSLYSDVEIVERLRDGATREEVALGCLHSVADRVMELGGLEPPLVVTGGVPAWYPGVVHALAERLETELHVVPEPTLVGALGAALLAVEEEPPEV